MESVSFAVYLTEKSTIFPIQRKFTIFILVLHSWRDTTGPKEFLFQFKFLPTIINYPIRNNVVNKEKPKTAKHWFNFVQNRVNDSNFDVDDDD